MKNLNKNNINESKLLDVVPEDVLDAILGNKTSLGNNPAIPDIFDIPFLFKIANERFSEVKESLKEIGKIDNIGATDVKTALNELIHKCIKIEMPYRDKLEKICVNTVLDLFLVPEDSIDLHVDLTDKINLNGKSIILDPIDGDDDFEFNDIDDAMSIKKEVMKRRMLDASSRQAFFITFLHYY